MTSRDRNIHWICLLMVLSGCCWAETQSTRWHFDFGPGAVKQGYTPCLPDTAFSPELGFGFMGDAKASAIDRDQGNALETDFVTCDPVFVL